MWQFIYDMSYNLPTVEIHVIFLSIIFVTKLFKDYFLSMIRCRKNRYQINNQNINLKTMLNKNVS